MCLLPITCRLLEIWRKKVHLLIYWCNYISSIASNYKQFSTNIKNKNPKIDTSFVRPGLRPLRADKTGFNLIIFHFNIRGKLSIIRCDKYLLSASYNKENIAVLMMGVKFYIYLFYNYYILVGVLICCASASYALAADTEKVEQPTQVIAAKPFFSWWCWKRNRCYRLFTLIAHLLHK